jgi:heme/copper-type cytochrome/quinol oxidase subunit 3
MDGMAKWWARICAVVTAAVLAVFVPAMAWAADNELVIEAARGYGRRRGGGLFFLASGLCCLAVIGGIIAVVVLLSRRRRKGPYDRP